MGAFAGPLPKVLDFDKLLSLCILFKVLLNFILFILFFD